MSNHVSGNARVGIQSDEVTITGGLFISMPPRRPEPADDQADDADSGEATAVQRGSRNAAAGRDRVGIQVGRSTTRRNK